MHRHTTDGVARPQERGGTGMRRSFRKPITTEELRQIAAEKFEEAAALPPGPDKQKILIAATGFQHAADVRGWLHPPQ
jgi:hypothetical protein